MKRNRLQRLASLALSMFVALSMMAVSTGGAYAASTWECPIGHDGALYQDEYTGVWVYNTNTGKSAKVTSVKSNNSKVAKVYKNTYKDENGKKQVSFTVQGKKPGKAKLTVKFKSGGKTKTIKKNISVKKYPNQIKSLKINGKKVKIKGDRKFYYSKSKYKKTSAKIKMQLQKGWKITHVYGNYSNYKNGKYGKISGVKKKITSGKKINFPKKWTDMYIYVEMKKGNDIISYDVSFWR